MFKKFIETYKLTPKRKKKKNRDGDRENHKQQRMKSLRAGTRPRKKLINDHSFFPLKAENTLLLTPANLTKITTLEERYSVCK